MSNSQRKYPLSRPLAKSLPSAHGTMSGNTSSPFRLSDCDRAELKQAAERRARMVLSPRERAAARHVDRVIATCGFAVQTVGTGECSHPGCDGGLATDPYSYTIGRAFFGLAELVTTGLSSRAAGCISNIVGQLMPWELKPGVELRVNGKRFRLDAIDPLWVDCDVSRIASWFANFARYHRPKGERPELWQIVWADPAGNFPDEPGCNQGVIDQQPLLVRDPIGYPPIDADLEWQIQSDAC